MKSMIYSTNTKSFAELKLKLKFGGKVTFVTISIASQNMGLKMHFSFSELIQLTV